MMAETIDFHPLSTEAVAQIFTALLLTEAARLATLSPAVTGCDDCLRRTHSGLAGKFGEPGDQPHHIEPPTRAITASSIRLGQEINHAQRSGNGQDSAQDLHNG